MTLKGSSCGVLARRVDARLHCAYLQIVETGEGDWMLQPMVLSAFADDGAAKIARCSSG